MGWGRADTARRALAGAGMALAMLLLAACGARLPDSGFKSLLQTPQQQPDTGMSPAVLREHQRILASYGGAYKDPRLQAMVDTLVERLVAASQRPDLHYKVTILNSDSVNAFALPTGQLYVTRGLIALANDESELAAVIGHEMGHVIARHAELREQEVRDEQLGDEVVADLSGPEATALALAKSKLKLAKFSQKQELQADEIGIGIAARAGLDPYGSVRFLASLERNAALKARSNGVLNPAAPDFLSSHPATPERMAHALALAGQYRPAAEDTPQRLAAARDAYLANLDGMVFGEDPSEGFVRGRRFLHPRLGFTFTAPEGFTLDNTAKAVLGIKRGGGAALRLDVVQVPAGQSLAQYLNSGWIENIDAGSVHEMTINGFPGASATAKGDEWNFRLYVIRFGSDVYRFVFASKNLTPQNDRSFRESVGTFRRMTLAEISRAKPLHLKVVTVRPGDTVEKLASRMVVPDRRVERFRVLNGLGPDDTLSPGREVKVVVE
ncbi:MAG: M48 family metalloprotease [Xanthobacteraceae bacterium]